MDEVTVLTCGARYGASKRVTKGSDGAPVVSGYNAGALFAVGRRPVTGITELSALLLELEGLPSAFVIRGAPVSDLPEAAVRRKKVNFRTPESGRDWVMIDLDKIVLPDGLDLARNTTAVIEHLVELLPPEFRTVTYHYQLSSSAGLGDPRKISAHLWFWLAEPCPDEKLKRWAKAVNKRAGYKLIDPALFNDVQAHYMAAPIFENVANPFPVRSGLVKKGHDAVSIKYIEAPAAPSLPASGGFEPGPGFEGWLTKIGDHPGGEGFHEPIIRAIASYVAEHGRDGTDTEELFRAVSTRVLKADRSKHEEIYVAHMAGRDHITPAIAGALEKYGDIPVSQRRSRLTSNVTPVEMPRSLPREEAYKELSGTLDQIMGSTTP